MGFLFEAVSREASGPGPTRVAQANAQAATGLRSPLGHGPVS